MAKYLVQIPYCLWLNVEVEADNEQEAEEAAFNEAGISSFAGNGGCGKLVGTSSQNAYVECGDEPLDTQNIGIEVHELS